MVTISIGGNIWEIPEEDAQDLLNQLEVWRSSQVVQSVTKWTSFGGLGINKIQQEQIAQANDRFQYQQMCKILEEKV